MSLFMVPPLDGRPWPTLGPELCDWIESNLVYGPGPLKGSPYVVEPEFRAEIYRMYEVFPRGHERAGRRRFKRAVLEKRKGTAKTEKAAILAAAEAHPSAPVRCDGWRRQGSVWVPVGVGVESPYIAMVAYTEEQSEDLAYGVLRQILGESQVADDFDIGLDRILVLDRYGREGGKIQALAGSPNARDGARTTFQHFDEPLALDTPVPTPSGWRRLGDLAADDLVFGRDGQPVRVLGASPVHIGRPCFRATFTDGSSVVTDGAHRWKATNWSNRSRGEQVVTTSQMLDRGIDTGYGLRWRLPRHNGFDGTKAELPIDPYLLGLWLGDGSTDAGYIHTSTADYAEISPGVAHTISTSAPGLVRWLPTGLRALLRRLEVLGAKHIPESYLFASREQRVDLLRGLMDSDGHTTVGGACTFVQKHHRLANDVATLVRSLGVQASMVETADSRSRSGSVWKVHFSPHFCPFRLDRKASRYDWRARRSTSWTAVAAIEPVESVPVRCIAVDSDDHLFLVGAGLVLTHNTHRMSSARLKNAHTTMVQNIFKIVSADAWTLETTTPGDIGEQSIAEDAHEYAQLIAKGKVSEPTLFYTHRSAPVDMPMESAADVRAALLEATGPATWSSDVDALVAHWFEPKCDRQYYRRVWLAQWVPGGSKAFDAAQFAALVHEVCAVAGPEGYRPPDGAMITLGFDGARRKDTTALVGTEVLTGFQWLVQVWERPEHADEAWEVPAGEVDAAVAECFKRWNVWRFYGDPPYWDEHIDSWAGQFGAERVIRWWTNRDKPMAHALRAYRQAHDDGDLSHDGHPVFVEHIGNSVRKKLLSRTDDDLEMWVIRKDRPDSPRKIDVAMAGCLSWEARGDAIAAGVAKPPPPKKSKKVRSPW